MRGLEIRILDTSNIKTLDVQIPKVRNFQSSADFFWTFVGKSGTQFLQKMIKGHSVMNDVIHRSI